MPPEPPATESEPVGRAAAGPARPSLPRRGLLRGGAIVAGAVAGGAAAALATPGVANAADGESVLAGRDNQAASSTGIKIGGGTGAEAAALALENENGPSLYLQPLDADFAGFMDLGQVTNTVLGPVIGVDTVLGQATTYLVTGVDLADVPTQYALPTAVRLLDTRTKAGRERIVTSSKSAFTSAGRLRAKAWMDIEVAPVAGDYLLPSVHLNVQAISPTGNGQLKAYRPATSVPAMTNLHYVKKKAGACASFVATGIVQGRYVVRFYASGNTHVVVDLTGYTVKGDAPTPQAAANRKSAERQQRQGAKTSAQRAAIALRLRTALADRARDALGR